MGSSKKKRLEDLVNVEKTLVTADYHSVYLDRKSFDAMLRFSDQYKPDNFIINGDLVDFYTISSFDKNPARADILQKEIDFCNQLLGELRDRLGKDTKMYFIEGNHDNRLQKYLWRHPEIESLDALKLDNMLHLDENDIKYIRCDYDYWKKSKGHLKIGDMLITHGDSRLNGAKGGKYAGYNTAINFRSNTIIGHVHRLSMKEHTAPNGSIVGIEGGCLCDIPGTANWQKGFVTFETYRGKTVNFELHPIKDGRTIFRGKVL